MVGRKAIFQVGWLARRYLLDLGMLPVSRVVCLAGGLAGCWLLRVD
jgi:hypothetical protein